MKRSRERMKGFIIGFAAAMVLSSSIMVAASTGVMREIFFGVIVTVHGERLELADDMQPFIMDGRTFLPARIVEQIADMPVSWDGETQTVAIGRTPIDEEALLGRWRVESIIIRHILSDDEEEIIDEEIPDNAYFEFLADGTMLATSYSYSYGYSNVTFYWTTRGGQLLLRYWIYPLLYIDVEITDFDLVLTDNYAGWGMYTIMTTKLTRVE